MYTRAANMFKMAKNWSGMYKVFICLLFRQITLRNHLEGGNDYLYILLLAETGVPVGITGVATMV